MFPDFKNSFPEKSFWHFDLHFVLKTFIWDIFQITEKKQQTKNNNFLTNIWRDNWRFINCCCKRTLLRERYSSKICPGSLQMRGPKDQILCRGKRFKDRSILQLHATASNTLESGINVPLRLLNFWLFSRGYSLIPDFIEPI